MKDLIQNQAVEQDSDKDGTLMNESYEIELRKLSDILDMLCIQAKKALEHEINLEEILETLLAVRKAEE